MLPSLESDVSLTNFLLELTDFSHLLKLVTKWSGLFRKGAEAHLGWSFGIQPFIGDVKSLFDSLMNYRQRIDEFIEKAEKVQRRHYRYKFDDDNDQTLLYNGTQTKYYRHDDWGTVFHATLIYKYEIPKELYTIRGKLNAIRDMVGLRANLGVIWEAIPFSFVVDWFLPIQEFLDGLSEPLIKPKMHVIDYCYSYKSYTKSYITRHFHKKCAGDHDFSDFRKTCDAEQKVYVRRKAIPETGTYFLPDSSNFGLRQLALSSSLLILSKR
jgi:hypothetical protein